MTKSNPTAAEKKAADDTAKKKAADDAAKKKAADDAAKKKAQAVPPIGVRCVDGTRFCRAGRCFGPVNETVTDYTPEQLEAWQDEERLIVTEDLVVPSSDPA